MNKENTHIPTCFGKLDVVFPMQPDGLRHSPQACLECSHKTQCLRSALESGEGLTLHEEKVDRAYESGNMGFLERWRKKKSIAAQRRTKKHNSRELPE